MSMFVTAPSDDSGLSNSDGVAHHQHGQLILVQIFGHRPGYIRRRHLFDSGAEAIQVVGGIAIEFVSHAFAQNLVGRIEIEDETVQDGILGALDLGFGNRMLGYIVDLFVEGLRSIRSWSRFSFPWTSRKVPG